MASTARIDELKRKFDENPRRYFAPLANEFRKAGDAEQAVMICEEFLPQQPGHMSGHIVYGQALFDLGRLDDARTVFETALTLDPENLIALRHLGDIARSHGDLETARLWYQRVLEADPRNEEVQALIASLDSESASAAPPAVPPAAPAGAPPALPPAPGPVMESLLELDVVEEHLFGAPEPESAPPPLPPELSLASLLESAPTPEPHRAPDLELESIGRAEGFEPMEFAPPASSATSSGGLADQLEPGEFEVPAASVAPLEGLEETAIGAFQAQPDAQPDAAPQSLLLPDLEPTSEAESAPDELPVDLPPEVIAAEAELIDAREGSRPSDERAEPTSIPSELDRAPADSSSAPSEPAVAQPELAPRVTPSQPFVTETMAELYVKQGFREQALDVYKLLLAASPENQHLRDRVAELQPSAEADTGPNVREFFARIAARRPGDAGAAAVPPASDDFASFDAFETLPADAPAQASVPAPQEDPTPAVASPDAPAPVAPASPPAASATTAGDGSIDALFGQRGGGSADDSAASALAQAFSGDESEPPTITGRPARAAAGELSLDSVFRDGGARPPRSAQSFSFDQFFSENASAESPADPAPTATPSQGTGAQSEPAERSADDIEQFNSWLQGLKQR